MPLKRLSLLLLLPLAIAACDNSQPSYSASNAPPKAPAPAAAPVAQPPAPAPVADTAPAVAEPPVVRQAPPRAAPAQRDSRSRFVQTPAGKMAAVDKLGIGSCDEYIEHYRACFNNTRIPHGQKFKVRETLTSQVRLWKAQSAAGKMSQVATACVAAREKAKAEFAQVGCSF